MELNHLRYFYEVARAKSFTQAAKNLYVSQPSLSKAVALLEEREGVKLLERGKSGVSLTPLGAKVFHECEKIFSTLESVRSLCQGTEQVCHGPLVIGSSDHIATYLLPKKIKQITTEHPLVKPSIFIGTPNDIVDRLQRRELELGFFFTKINSPQITYSKVFSVPMIAVCHPSLMKSQRSAKGAKGFDESLLGNYIGSFQKHYTHYPAMEILEELKEKPKIRFETNSQELQKRLCMEGAGSALLARFMVEEEIKKGLLAEIPMREKKSMDLLVATRKGHELSLNARTFLELLKS